MKEKDEKKEKDVTCILGWNKEKKITLQVNT